MHVSYGNPANANCLISFSSAQLFTVHCLSHWPLPVPLGDYRPWNIPPIKRREPDPYRPPTVPFEALPSYRTEFVPHCQARPKLIKPDNELSFSDKPLEGLTDYRQNYVPHPLEKRPAPPKPIVRAQAPFEGMTTTQVDYTPKEFCTYFPPLSLPVFAVVNYSPGNTGSTFPTIASTTENLVNGEITSQVRVSHQKFTQCPQNPDRSIKVIWSSEGRCLFRELSFAR
ncbi:unnamed protein product [Dibothriocephalus latus]|uniref:Uncharacterized protein n=1 Tax=Dibothriocephalus latus TaxID=60516 RepID=A0A3P7PHZ7_DIBLA|nr:unnamed protein product [Dibothriocephalus latus]